MIPVLILWTILGIGVFAYYKYEQSKLTKKFEAYQLEINKLSSSLTSRGQNINREFIQFIVWINNIFPQELTKTVYLDSKLLTLKDKAEVSDAEYMESFENVLISLQNTISKQVQNHIDSINANLLKEVKEKMLNDQSV